MSEPSQPDLLRGSAQAALRHLRAGTLNLTALPPLSLYVHLPWCLKKCPYCDFNSHAWAQDRVLPEDRYLQALRCDLESALALVWGRRVVSVFIGGGTPSLFSPDTIARLLGEIRSLLPLVAGCEITLEANPGTFEARRFEAYRQAGVTRLSIGVQSFDDAALVRIGRVHSGAQARAAVEEAATVYGSFNLDLMYALPQQTLQELRADLDTALSFQPPHLSVYHLTLEANTWFASHPPQLPDSDLASDMLDLVIERSAEVGLERYEVSAFAKPRHRCQHNLNYWEFGDYLGIGAGAHSKLSFAHRVVRQVRWREPNRYMDQALAGAPISNEDEVQRKALAFEFMLNGLRLREGLTLDRFSTRTGLPMSALQAQIEQAERRGLLTVKRDAVGRLEHVMPTPRGFDFLSDLQSLFLPAD